MRRTTVLVTGLLLIVGLAAGPALAHHGADRELPPGSPHALGVPQLFWEAGTEIAAILGADGQPIALNGFVVPAVLADDLDFPFDFWLVARLGGTDLIGGRIEGFEPTGEFRTDIGLGDLVNPLSGQPTAEGTEPGDFVWIQTYPHAHHVVLHAGTDRERCVDLANGRVQRTPNQHNAKHIGTAGHGTPGGYANAGHEIHDGTCG